ncbi:MAG TPA: type II toxin-antitoxin system RelE/ParE family toxin [Opitutaceae bacterium]|jgi:plasmid stabilization system protein ParE
MDYRVIISKPALTDLGVIARFIAQGPNGSSTSALKIGEELIAQCESLSTLPNRGSIVRRKPGMRKLSHRYYLIFYRVTDASRLVEIVRIWDGRQNPSALILL